MATAATEATVYLYFHQKRNQAADGSVGTRAHVPITIVHDFLKLAREYSSNDDGYDNWFGIAFDFESTPQELRPRDGFARMPRNKLDTFLWKVREYSTTHGLEPAIPGGVPNYDRPVVFNITDDEDDENGVDCFYFNDYNDVYDLRLPETEA